MMLKHTYQAVTFGKIGLHVLHPADVTTYRLTAQLATHHSFLACVTYLPIVLHTVIPHQARMQMGGYGGCNPPP